MIDFGDGRDERLDAIEAETTLQTKQHTYKKCIAKLEAEVKALLACRVQLREFIAVCGASQIEDQEYLVVQAANSAFHAVLEVLDKQDLMLTNMGEAGEE